MKTNDMRISDAEACDMEVIHIGMSDTEASEMRTSYMRSYTVEAKSFIMTGIGKAGNTAVGIDTRKHSRNSGRYSAWLRLPALLLAALMIITAVSCSVPGTSSGIDLMLGVSAAAIVDEKAPDTAFTAPVADFSLKLFKLCATNDENVLVSPTSVILALAMTANGAAGNTLRQMEKVIGGNLTIKDLNKYLRTYTGDLMDTGSDKVKVNIANSIWFRDSADFTVEKDFLQTNADYYMAAAYKSDFNSAATVKEINKWVKDKTNGMIDSIIDRINPATLMFLINATTFEAEWETVYYKSDVSAGDFKQDDGTVSKADFMYSTEKTYISGVYGTSGKKAAGFLKPYAGGTYSFMALLPEEGTDIDDFITQLDGAALISMIKAGTKESVDAALPKFSYEFEKSINNQLEYMGIADAFDPGIADFSKLGKFGNENIFIGDVLHKTFIEVDELGTRAGAVTKIEMAGTSFVERKEVRLDRPFVYAIIDNTTYLPVFVGAVKYIK